jgi:hypothetical protein
MHRRHDRSNETALDVVDMSGDGNSAGNLRRIADTIDIDLHSLRRIEYRKPRQVAFGVAGAFLKPMTEIVVG